jgi:hypothetical protein
MSVNAVPVTNITDDGRSPGQAKLTKAVTEASSWGKEIGIAMREAGAAFLSTSDGALTITEKHLTSFTDSKAGKFTMIILGWHFLGKGLISLFLGLLIFFITSTMLWKIHNKLFLPQRVLISSKPTGYFRKEKTYETVEPSQDWVGFNWILAMIMQAIIIGISVAIIF